MITFLMFKKHSSVNHSLFFFIEKQQKTSNELGAMKGIFLSKSYHNGIHIHDRCWGSTGDLVTTCLFGIVLCFIVTELQLASVGVKFAVLWMNRTGAQQVIIITITILDLHLIN